MPSTVSSFFFHLAAGFSLFLLLGLAACGGNVCVAEGGESRTQNLPMKMDFEDISRFGVRLSLPSAMQKLPPQAASPSSKNRDNPAARRKKKYDTVNDGV